MNKFVLPLVLIISIVAIFFYLYFYKGMPSNQYDFQQLINSCDLGSEKYVVCCLRNNLVGKCAEPLSLNEGVAIKVNVASLTNATGPYYLCMIDGLYHPPYQLPQFPSSGLPFMQTLYKYSGDSNLYLNYDSTKAVDKVIMCSYLLYPNKNYQFMTYGLVGSDAIKEIANLPSDVLSDVDSFSTRLLLGSKYPEGTYHNVADFQDKQNISTAILELNMEVLIK